MRSSPRHGASYAGWNALQVVAPRIADWVPRAEVGMRLDIRLPSGSRAGTPAESGRVPECPGCVPVRQSNRFRNLTPHLCASFAMVMATGGSARKFDSGRDLASLESMLPFWSATKHGEPVPKSPDKSRPFSVEARLTSMVPIRPVLRGARWTECLPAELAPEAGRAALVFRSKTLLAQRPGLLVRCSIGVVRDRTTRGYRQRSFESGSTTQK